MNSCLCTAAVLLFVVAIESAAATGTSCKKPVGVVCGRCTSDTYSVKSKCYGCKCADGYVEDGSGRRLKCVRRRYRNGTVTALWQGTKCDKARDCVVPDFANLTVSGQEVKHGERIRMKCAEGHYLLYGANVSKCDHGLFYPPIHDVYCYGIQCRPPGPADIPPEGIGSVFYHGSNIGPYRFGYGSKLRYECNEGYRLVGRKTRRCRADGKWEGQPAQCKRIICRPRDGGPQEPLPAGSNITLPNNNCPQGHVPSESTTLWTCGKNGAWLPIPATVTCLRQVPCGRPPSVTGAKVTRRHKDKSFTQGDEVVYKCKRRHEQVGGNATRQCDNGIWQGEDIICSKKGTCGPLRPRNGFCTVKDNSMDLSRNTFKYGEIIKFSCNDGYHLEGSTQATCMVPKWKVSNGFPLCKRKKRKDRKLKSS